MNSLRIIIFFLLLVMNSFSSENVVVSSIADFKSGDNFVYKAFVNDGNLIISVYNTSSKKVMIKEKIETLFYTETDIRTKAFIGAANLINVKGGDLIPKDSYVLLPGSTEKYIRSDVYQVKKNYLQCSNYVINLSKILARSENKSIKVDLTIKGMRVVKDRLVPVNLVIKWNNRKPDKN
jgi:hypothetical protein